MTDRSGNGAGLCSVGAFELFELFLTRQRGEEVRFCTARLSHGCSDCLGKRATLANDCLNIVIALQWC